MEMERINENTIRVLIESEDLEERGITFLDLLGNHKQIENFFYSILEEVDVEEQFQETDAVTFQVLPNKNGLELFISKNMVMNEPSEFAQMSEGMDQEDFSEFVKQQLVSGTPLESIIQDEILDDEIDSPTMEVVLHLDTFEDLIRLSKDNYLDDVSASLYKLNDTYFLHLLFYMEATTNLELETEVAKLLEFTNLTYVTHEVLGEYGQLIMDGNALSLTRHYFK